LRPSHTCSAAFAIAHLAAVGIAAFALPPWPWTALCCTVIVLMALWDMPRHVLLRSPKSVVGVELGGDADCTLLLRDGERISGRVRASSYVIRQLVVLHWAPPGRWWIRCIPIWPDSASEVMRRRLRVRLRWAQVDGTKEGLADRPL